MPAMQLPAQSEVTAWITFQSIGSEFLAAADIKTIYRQFPPTSPWQFDTAIASEKMHKHWWEWLLLMGRKLTIQCAEVWDYYSLTKINVYCLLSSMFMHWPQMKCNEFPPQIPVGSAGLCGNHLEFRWCSLHSQCTSFIVIMHSAAFSLRTKIRILFQNVVKLVAN